MAAYADYIVHKNTEARLGRPTRVGSQDAVARLLIHQPAVDWQNLYDL